MKARRPRPGDVIEIPLKSGFGYCIYLGRHAVLGDTVWILAGSHSEHVSEFPVTGETGGYYAFYPAIAAAKAGLVRIVGYRPEALREVPEIVRYIVNVDENGLVGSWLVTDGAGLRIPRTQLSEEERQLPIGSIWNHALLVERIETNWRPWLSSTQ